MVATKHPQRVYVARERSFGLDSTASILMDLLTSIEAQGAPSFAIVGGYVRNSLVDKPYNDFDICTQDPGQYRKVLVEMGLLKMPTRGQIDGIRQHDQFTNPYDMRAVPFNIHWIESTHREGFAPETFDFSINEFALKSDGQVYAPTITWWAWEKRLIKLNPQRDPKKFTTNLALRAIRFAALLNFQIEENTANLILEKFAAPDKIDQIRLKRVCEKMISDGTGESCMQRMRELGFETPHDSLDGVIEEASFMIQSGKIYHEQHTDYHDDDMIW